MGTPFADMSDTLLGWASTSELRLAERLDGVSYFPDADFTSDELERFDRFYGVFLSRQTSAGAKLAELLDVTPTLFTTTLISQAWRMRDPERFFDDYLPGLGLEARPEWVSLIRERAPRALTVVGLEDEGPDGTRYEGVKLLRYHAGIVGADVAEILERLDAGETPAGRLIPGVQALREFSLAHPTSWPDRDRSGLTPRLPAMVEEAVVAELRERPAGTVDRATAVGVAHRELRPRLLYDGRRGRVCLRLPEQRVAPLPGAAGAEVAWRVSIAGTTRLFRTGRPWGEPIYAEALDVAVDTQVRAIEVADLTNGIEWSVPVVDETDPVLIFAANGQNLTDKLSLHHSRLSVVAPEDASLVDVVGGEEIPVIATNNVQGWDGWAVRTVDAAHVASMQVVRAGHKPSPLAQLRSVDPRQRVRFVHPSPPVANVVTGGRAPVYPASLVADFPPTVSREAETWQLSISAFTRVGEETQEITEPEPLEVPAEGGVFEIFDPEAYDAPWVGEYLIRLRGPRNESFRHRYAIVEGMQATTEISSGADVRIPSGGGLSMASLTIRPGEKDFSVSPGRVTVRETEAAADFVVATEEGDSLPLRFVPPALRFELAVTSYPPMWRASRMYLVTRTIEGGGRVRVRGAGELGRPRVVVRNHHGSPIRTTSLTAEDAVTYSVPWAELARTASVLPEGRLDLEWEDVSSGQRLSVALAELSSTPHATGVEVREGRLVFSGLAESRRLSAWVWPATAPWVAATTLEDPRDPLPPRLVDAGDLIVQLFSADPYTALRSPLRPGDQSLLATQQGFFAEQDDVYARLSAFLAGAADEPPAEPEVFPIIWDHVVWDQGNLDAVAKVLRGNPGEALAGLAGSLVPAELKPGRMIATGLVAMPFSASVADEDLPSPWASALLLLGRLDPGNPDAGVLARLREIAGENLVATLRTGRDTTLDTSCVDASTVRIAHMNEAQQEQLIAMFFANADIVPGAPMQDGPRLMAVFEAFRRRAELNRLLAQEDLIRPSVRLMRGIRAANRGLGAAARVRMDKLVGVDFKDPRNAWALAPVVSLVFALAARGHAHGVIGKTKTLEAVAPGWARLAELLPDLVTGDILSAEAMVLAA